MALPRWLSSPGVSAFINACAIFFLCANLVQNYVMFHTHAVGQHATMVAPDDHLPPPVESRPQRDDLGVSISIAIPRGKAVAMPSIQISAEEEEAFDRGQYGGKGDKPHLGGFTEFDVRDIHSMNMQITETES